MALEPITILAIRQFEKVMKEENKLKKLNEELEEYVKQIPDIDVPEYWKQTEMIRKKLEEVV